MIGDTSDDGVGLSSDEESDEEGEEGSRASRVEDEDFNSEDASDSEDSEDSAESSLCVSSNGGSDDESIQQLDIENDSASALGDSVVSDAEQEQTTSDDAKVASDSEGSNVSDGEEENGDGTDESAAKDVARRAASGRGKALAVKSANARLSAVTKSFKVASIVTAVPAASTSNHRKRAAAAVTAASGVPPVSGAGVSSSTKAKVAKPESVAVSRERHETPRVSSDHSAKKKKRKRNAQSYDVEKSEKEVISVEVSTLVVDDSRKNTFFNIRKDFVNKGIPFFLKYNACCSHTSSCNFRCSGLSDKALHHRRHKRTCVFLHPPVA